MNNLFQDYLNDWMSRTEKAMPQYRPQCADCRQPITGESYNGRCVTCAGQSARSNEGKAANWRKASRE